MHLLSRIKILNTQRLFLIGKIAMNCVSKIGTFRSDKQKDCNIEIQKKCNNGECILKAFLCDGENDCRDGSDESNCKLQKFFFKLNNCRVLVFF